MTWDTATARARIGLPDNDDSRDALLDAAMAVALAAAESYCDRAFLLQEESEDFRDPARTLNVRRWPLVSLDGVLPLPPWSTPPPDLLAVPEGWGFDARRGIVYLCSAAGGIAPVGSTPPPLTWGSGFVLAYTGGYDPEALPADLEAALWLAFDSAWYATPGWGAAGGSNAAGAPVKSFGIDGMSVSYDNAAGGGSGAGAGAAPGAWGILPATAVAILNFYRAESAALGA